MQATIEPASAIEALHNDQYWLLFFGLGCLWLGGQILWVAPLPRQLRRGPSASAPRGSDQAFQLFWIDQYGWIGIGLCAIGLLCSAVQAGISL